MKGIAVREFGDTGVLKIEELPLPKPGPGQVFVRIKAAGVTPAGT
jgi:NADPH2:quinone reductase